MEEEDEFTVSVNELLPSFWDGTQSVRRTLVGQVSAAVSLLDSLVSDSVTAVGGKRSLGDIPPPERKSLIHHEHIAGQSLMLCFGETCVTSICITGVISVLTVFVCLALLYLRRKKAQHVSENLEPLLRSMPDYWKAIMEKKTDANINEPDFVKQSNSIHVLEAGDSSDLKHTTDPSEFGTPDRKTPDRQCLINTSISSSKVTPETHKRVVVANMGGGKSESHVKAQSRSRSRSTANGLTPDSQLYQRVPKATSRSGKKGLEKTARRLGPPRTCSCSAARRSDKSAPTSLSPKGKANKDRSRSPTKRVATHSPSKTRTAPKTISESKPVRQTPVLPNPNPPDTVDPTPSSAQRRIKMKRPHKAARQKVSEMLNESFDKHKRRFVPLTATKSDGAAKRADGNSLKETRGKTLHSRDRKRKRSRAQTKTLGTVAPMEVTAKNRQNSRRPSRHCESDSGCTSTLAKYLEDATSKSAYGDAKGTFSLKKTPTPLLNSLQGKGAFNSYRRQKPNLNTNRRSAQITDLAVSEKIKSSYWPSRNFNPLTLSNRSDNPSSIFSKLSRPYPIVPSDGVPESGPWHNTGNHNPCFLQDFAYYEQSDPNPDLDDNRGEDASYENCESDSKPDADSVFGVDRMHFTKKGGWKEEQTYMTFPRIVSPSQRKTIFSREDESKHMILSRDKYGIRSPCKHLEMLDFSKGTTTDNATYRKPTMRKRDVQRKICRICRGNLKKRQRALIRANESEMNLEVRSVKPKEDRSVRKPLDSLSKTKIVDDHHVTTSRQRQEPVYPEADRTLGRKDNNQVQTSSNDSYTSASEETSGLMGNIDAISAASERHLANSETSKSLSPIEHSSNKDLVNRSNLKWKRDHPYRYAPYTPGLSGPGEIQPPKKQPDETKAETKSSDMITKEGMAKNRNNCSPIERGRYFFRAERVCVSKDDARGLAHTWADKGDPGYNVRHRDLAVKAGPGNLLGSNVGNDRQEDNWMDSSVKVLRSGSKGRMPFVVQAVSTGKDCVYRVSGGLGKKHDVHSANTADGKKLQCIWGYDGSQNQEQTVESKSLIGPTPWKMSTLSDDKTGVEDDTSYRNEGKTSIVYDHDLFGYVEYEKTDGSSFNHALAPTQTESIRRSTSQTLLQEQVRESQSQDLITHTETLQNGPNSDDFTAQSHNACAKTPDQNVLSAGHSLVQTSNASAKTLNEVIGTPSCASKLTVPFQSALPSDTPVTESSCLVLRHTAPARGHETSPPAGLALNDTSKQDPCSVATDEASKQNAPTDSNVSVAVQTSPGLRASRRELIIFRNRKSSSIVPKLLRERAALYKKIKSHKHRFKTPNQSIYVPQAFTQSWFQTPSTSDNVTVLSNSNTLTTQVQRNESLRDQESSLPSHSLQDPPNRLAGTSMLHGNDAPYTNNIEHTVSMTEEVSGMSFENNSETKVFSKGQTETNLGNTSLTNTNISKKTPETNGHTTTSSVPLRSSAMSQEDVDKDRKVMSHHPMDEPSQSSTIHNGGSTSNNGRETLTSNCAAPVGKDDTTTSPLRMSSLQCMLRPLWKNANVEELNRRVERALKLRELLQKSKLSKESLRKSVFGQMLPENSLIDAGQQDETAGDGKENVGPVENKLPDSSMGLHPFELYQDNAPGTETIEAIAQETANVHCQRICFNRNASDALIEARNAHSYNTKDANRRSPDTITSARNHEVENDEPEKHESQTTGSETFIPTTPDNASQEAELFVESFPDHQWVRMVPNDMRSDNTIGAAPKRTAVGMCQKSSPPTKISKRENVLSSSSHCRLVDEVVRSLPHVPLSSFVEWFIETSDPNNFLQTDPSSGSSGKQDGTPVLKPVSNPCKREGGTGDASVRPEKSAATAEGTEKPMLPERFGLRCHVPRRDEEAELSESQTPSTMAPSNVLLFSSSKNTRPLSGNNHYLNLFDNTKAKDSRRKPDNIRQKLKKSDLVETQRSRHPPRSGKSIRSPRSGKSGKLSPKSFHILSSMSKSTEAPNKPFHRLSKSNENHNFESVSSQGTLLTRNSLGPTAVSTNDSGSTCSTWSQSYAQIVKRSSPIISWTVGEENSANTASIFPRPTSNRCSHRQAQTDKNGLSPSSTCSKSARQKLRDSAQPKIRQILMKLRDADSSSPITLHKKKTRIILRKTSGATGIMAKFQPGQSKT